MEKGEDHKFLPMTSINAGKTYEVGPDIFYYTNQIVNVIMIGEPDQDNWFLIDAGMPKSAEHTLRIARRRFGNNKPKAIFLTHGHFDHVGGLVDLLSEWYVPVYAHLMELPYLSGNEDYPEPDPTVEGGLIAKMSKIFPNDGINISEVLNPLPADGMVPGFSDWKWIHTPGHSPGHVSFFRASDSSLIAGDAFVTVRQDSLYKVITQIKEVNGPPRYLTTDWDLARESVQKLQRLNPQK
jgi:glyoxylase-like metal-dependent hydrolase (beta-lactamase superfamily II)